MVVSSFPFERSSKKNKIENATVALERDCKKEMIKSGVMDSKG